jgi:hypothetical protein
MMLTTRQSEDENRAAAARVETARQAKPVLGLALAATLRKSKCASFDATRNGPLATGPASGSRVAPSSQPGDADPFDRRERRSSATMKTARRGVDAAAGLKDSNDDSNRARKEIINDEAPTKGPAPCARG